MLSDCRCASAASSTYICILYVAAAQAQRLAIYSFATVLGLVFLYFLLPAANLQDGSILLYVRKSSILE